MAEVFAKLRHRIDLAAYWAATNPVPLRGELVFEEDTAGFKIGDGVRDWASLPYRVSPTAFVPVLSLTGTIPTVGTVGVSGAFSLTASGGTSPYVFGHSGTIPPGLTFVSTSTTGGFTGSLTAAGTYAGAITATDADGNTAIANYSIVVAATGAALTISGSSPTTATVGVSYTGDFNSAGGTAPVVFSVASGTLPAGLTLNASTGTISGTPTAAGTSAGIVIRATDALGAVANAASFTITVAAGASSVTVSGSPATTGNIGNAYSATFTASGGTGPYTYSISAGTLPAGLAINASTGVISGQPTTAGAQTGITVRAVDSLGAAGTATPFTITVAAAMTITGSPATTATVGTPYTFTPTVVGGVGTKTFSLVAGTLPTGLSLNTSTGVISGQPTTVQTQTGLSLRVTDSATTPQTATLATFQIAVSGAAANTKPRFFVAPANAHTTGTQGYLDAATDLTGSSNGGHTGTFNLTTSAGNYGWCAVLASASSSGVTFTDVGAGNLPGGWSGAGLSGVNTGSSPATSTSTVTVTDSASSQVVRLFRQDYPNANPTAEAWSIA